MNKILEQVKNNIYTYNFYMFVISFFIAFAFNVTGVSSVSLPTAIMASVDGLSLVFGQIFLIKA